MTVLTALNRKASTAPLTCSVSFATSCPHSTQLKSKYFQSNFYAHLTWSLHNQSHVRQCMNKMMYVNDNCQCCYCGRDGSCPWLHFCTVAGRQDALFIFIYVCQWFTFILWLSPQNWADSVVLNEMNRGASPHIIGVTPLIMKTRLCDASKRLPYWNSEAPPPDVCKSMEAAGEFQAV